MSNQEEQAGIQKYRWLTPWLMRLVGRWLGPKAHRTIFGMVNIIRVPKSIIIGDAGLGRQIFYGEMTLYGRKKPISKSSIQRKDSWAIAYNEFQWLYDLKAVESVQAGTIAWKYVEEWISSSRKSGKSIWTPYANSRRISAILGCYDMLKESATPWQLGGIRAFLSFSITHLIHSAKENTKQEHIGTYKGIIATACCVAGYRYLLPKTLKTIEQLLEQQFTSDGCHKNRNPEEMLKWLEDIIDIQQWLKEAYNLHPVALRASMDKIATALRSLRHSDGGLAVFHGGTEGNKDQVDRVLHASKINSKPMPSLPYGGYIRLHAKKMLLIMDAPTKEYKKGYDSALGIEMSIGENRVVVSSGGWYDNEAMERMAKRRDSFSTMILRDSKGKIISSVGKARYERRNDDGVEIVSASYTGYKKLKVNYHRNLNINATGTHVFGEEMITSESSGGIHHATIRFHLHPSVKIHNQETANQLILSLQDNSRWIFKSDNPLQCSEGRYMGVINDIRRCMVIDIPCPNKAISRVQWLMHQKDD